MLPWRDTLAFSLPFPLSLLFFASADVLGTSWVIALEEDEENVDSRGWGEGASLCVALCPVWSALEGGVHRSASICNRCHSSGAMRIGSLPPGVRSSSGSPLLCCLFLLLLESPSPPAISLQALWNHALSSRLDTLAASQYRAKNLVHTEWTRRREYPLR